MDSSSSLISWNLNISELSQPPVYLIKIIDPNGVPNKHEKLIKESLISRLSYHLICLDLVFLEGHFGIAVESN